VIPSWLKPLLSLFAGLAWIGLALCVLSHLSALSGNLGPFAALTHFIVVGLFIVWFPTVLVAARMGAEFKQKDLWKAVLRGCPPWMKYMVWGFFGYAFVNFATFIIAAPTKSSPGPMTPSDLRAISGHLMAFYSVAAAILYSATHAEDRDRARRCANGHAVGPLAQFCEQCGQAVVKSP